MPEPHTDLCPNQQHILIRIHVDGDHVKIGGTTPDVLLQHKSVERHMDLGGMEHR